MIDRSVGLHLQQGLSLIETPRPSVLAELDLTARLTRLVVLDTDEAILDAMGDGQGVVAVDAPLAVPNRGGRREFEQVLAWLDVPTFPTSRARLEQLHGGIRGERLAPALESCGWRPVEAVPDFVLRHLIWSGRPDSATEPDLARFRAGWLECRPPRYRPKGAGRAHPAGIAETAELLARVVDLGDWRPADSPDDWQAIADAAVLDAVACAVSAHVAVHDPRRSVTIGTRDLGVVVNPAGPHLRQRLEVNLERLRDEGAISI
ncbi:MAG: hypothetical protein H6531_08455 [Actinobacteria bacterium]|nr:hypothetical protein [Actinomycetota bacterium]